MEYLGGIAVDHQCGECKLNLAIADTSNLKGDDFRHFCPICHTELKVEEK